MKLIWLQIFFVPKENAYSLCNAEDLSGFSFWQRSTVREHLIFASRISAARCPEGSRLTVSLKEVPFNCHVFRRTNGLTGIAMTDNEYPERVAHSLISKFLNEFEKSVKGNWKSITKDENFTFGKLAEYLKEYSDPEQADKYYAAQKNLDELKDIIHKNIEEVLRRGETITRLMEESEDLGREAKLFHKKAKKYNQCCTWY